MYVYVSIFVFVAYKGPWGQVFAVEKDAVKCCTEVNTRLCIKCKESHWKGNRDFADRSGSTVSAHKITINLISLSLFFRCVCICVRRMVRMVAPLW